MLARYISAWVSRPAQLVPRSCRALFFGSFFFLQFSALLFFFSNGVGLFFGGLVCWLYPPCQ